MKILRRACYALLVTLLVIVSANAFADHPVDPSFSEMRAFKQKERRYIQQAKQAQEPGGKEIHYASGSVSISVSGTVKPTGTLTFTANVSGVSNTSGYYFLWGVSDEGRDSSGYLFYPQHVYDDGTDERLGLKTIKYKFYYAGRYSAFVDVYDSNRSWVGSDWYEFTIADDGTHPTLEKKAAQIVNACKASDKWHTALNLYDWLTHHAYYDETRDYHGADILFTGYGVCDSYSKAYELLLQTAGIPVERTFGPNHAWNTLLLGGKWYQADATWDDGPAARPGEGTLYCGSEGHEFFCVNTAAMLGVDSHHYYDGSQEGEHAAQCTAMDANYFIHEGLWKAFGEYEWVYDYDAQEWVITVYPYTDLILEGIAAGNPEYEISVSTYVYYTDSSGSVESLSFHQSILREIMKAGMPKYTFKLNGDKLKMKVTVSDNLAVTAKLTGWDIKETGKLKLPKGTKRVGAHAFRKTAATTLVIQQGCEKIEAGAFAYSAIRTVRVPLSVKSIADNAFAGCGKIIMITKNQIAIDYAVAHGMMVAVP